MGQKTGAQDHKAIKCQSSVLNLTHSATLLVACHGTTLKYKVLGWHSGQPKVHFLPSPCSPGLQVCQAPPHP